MFYPSSVIFIAAIQSPIIKAPNITHFGSLYIFFFFSSILSCPCSWLLSITKLVVFCCHPVGVYTLRRLDHVLANSCVWNHGIHYRLWTMYTHTHTHIHTYTYISSSTFTEPCYMNTITPLKNLQHYPNYMFNRKFHHPNFLKIRWKVLPPPPFYLQWYCNIEWQGHFFLNKHCQLWWDNYSLVCFYFFFSPSTHSCSSGLLTKIPPSKTTATLIKAQLGIQPKSLRVLLAKSQVLHHTEVLNTKQGKKRKKEKKTSGYSATVLVGHACSS